MCKKIITRLHRKCQNLPCLFLGSCKKLPKAFFRHAIIPLWIPKFTNAASNTKPKIKCFSMFHYSGLSKLICANLAAALLIDFFGHHVRNCLNFFRHEASRFPNTVFKRLNLEFKMFKSTNFRNKYFGATL